MLNGNLQQSMDRSILNALIHKSFVNVDRFHFAVLAGAGHIPRQILDEFLFPFVKKQG